MNKWWVHSGGTCRLWPRLATRCCHALRHEIQGDALTSEASGSSPGHLGSCWSAELPPNWQHSAHALMAGSGCCHPPVICLFFFFAPIGKMARRHMAAWPRVSEKQLLDSLLSAREGVCTGSFVGIRADARFRFSHLTYSPYFFSFAWPRVRRCSSLSYRSPPLFFSWMFPRGFEKSQITWPLWLQTLAIVEELAKEHITPYGRPIDETVFVLYERMWWQRTELHWNYIWDKPNYPAV